MGKFRKFMMMGVASCMAVTMFAGCGSDGKDAGSDSNEVKLGLNFELTGAAATYVNTELNGIKFAMKEFNAKEGNKFKYVGVEGDNKSDNAEATNIATKMVSEDKVDAFVGPATTGASLAIYDVANNANVFVISPSATGSGVTTKQNGDVYENVYRVCFEDDYQGAAMAVYARETLKVSKAAVLMDNSEPYSKGLSAAFESKFKEEGGNIVIKENYQSKDTDFNASLTKIKNSGCDALYIPGYYTEVGTIIKQAREMGINVPIIGGDGFDSSDLVKLAGDKKYLNDVYFTTAYTTVNASDELKAFIEAYKKEYGEDPSMFSALAYDAANLMMQAYEEAGTKDHDAVKEVLDKMEFKGVTGTFTFDEKHTPKKAALVVKVVDGEQKEAVEVDPNK